MVSKNNIAAAVFAWKAYSGLLDQRYICTGKAVEGSNILCGISTIKATIPIKINGAVSPIALAMLKMTPVAIPGNDSGKV